MTPFLPRILCSSALLALVVTASPLLAATDAPGPGQGADANGFVPYVPSYPVTGVIRSWGHGYLKRMMKLWEAGFQQYHPHATFQDDLVSSAAAMAGLYSGRADLGVLAREITPPEVAAYEKVTRQPLTPVTVLTGSVGNQDKIMALGVFVNAANPLSQLTFAQLDAIFGCERLQGEPATMRTWGDVVRGGEWTTLPITPYSGLAFEAPGAFFSKTVLRGSVLWNPNLRQFDNVEDATARYVDAYQKVVDAVASDRSGIGIAGAGYHNPGAKLVALAVGPDGPFVLPNRETIRSRTYPLSRPVRFYINNGPKVPANPDVVEFLRYVLSREGQAQVVQEGDFLPLTAAMARAELERLPASTPPIAPRAPANP